MKQMKLNFGVGIHSQVFRGKQKLYEDGESSKQINVWRKMFIESNCVSFTHLFFKMHNLNEKNCLYQYHALMFRGQQITHEFSGLKCNKSSFFPWFSWDLKDFGALEIFGIHVAHIWGISDLGWNKKSTESEKK